MIEIIITALENPVNLVIIIAIGILALLDIVFKKDLKSQIVSLGVLGTFIGIFMGLQDFNPLDMKNSVNGILDGLKTAFFTSIIGMGTALLLSIFQRLFNKNMDDSNNQENILKEISEKLNHLEKLNQTQETDKIIGELERLRTVQSDTRDETKKWLFA
ncbi:MAG: MotA/TolQ/ExbB proton channel family protein [Sulfurovum sp.]|nr:MotA/TolQ/ExbB proton channel family protein [Sulfurovum sp.]